MPIVQLVANPAAGRHSTRKVDALERAFVRAGATLIRTECGPDRPFTIDHRAAHVCVVGGDGTARHAAFAAGRQERAVAISLYPAGTVNLLNRETGCELDPDRYAARILGGGNSRSHYAAALGDGLFLTCASVGPDSAAVAGLSSRLKRRIGRAAYVVAFLSVLAKWSRVRIRLHHDGQTVDCEAFYVAKGRYFAGPWSFAPDARLDAPLLHVVALRKATRLAYARFAWALFRGRPVGQLPDVTTFACTTLSADCATALPVQADGDIAATLPVKISLIERPFLFC
jgi:diacylglycerol kinase family enzyme